MPFLANLSFVWGTSTIKLATVKKSPIFCLIASVIHCSHFSFSFYSQLSSFYALLGHMLLGPALLLAFCLSVFVLLPTPAPDFTQLPDGGFPKSMQIYMCFLVSKRSSTRHSTLSVCHLGSSRAYVWKAGREQECAYYLLNFHFVLTSCLPTLVVVGVQKKKINNTLDDCWFHVQRHLVAASDSRPVTLPWFSPSHTGSTNKSPYLSSKMHQRRHIIAFSVLTEMPIARDDQAGVRKTEVCQHVWIDLSHRPLSSVLVLFSMPKWIIHKPMSVLWAFF